MWRNTFRAAETILLYAVDITFDPPVEASGVVCSG